MSAALAASPPDPGTDTWVRELRDRGATARQAERRLHALLLRRAYAELARRGQRASTDRDLDDLAHQAADDAVVAVLAKLDRFRGESRFATWATRFVLLEVTNKLSRRYLHRHEQSVYAADWSARPDRAVAGPDAHAGVAELAAAVRDSVQRDLTDRQRQVFRAAVFDGRAADDLARELGCSVGAVHKTMSDARHRLRAGLALRGY